MRERFKNENSNKKFTRELQNCSRLTKLQYFQGKIEGSLGISFLYKNK